ncbi:hypothetical protein AAG906_005956 [Vitis piasezkii]
MDIVSSHSWSHSNQKMRKLTSLSLKSLSKEGNFKEIEKKKNRIEIGAKTEQKQRKNRALRNFAG